jgi:hypothetical protein
VDRRGPSLDITSGLAAKGASMSKGRHNEIRPTSQVFAPEDGIVFEVALAAGVPAFTWAVLREVDTGTQTVAVGWKPRSGGTPAAEHSISLISAVEVETSYNAAWQQAHADREDVDATLAEGDYRLVLYAGRPATGETGFAYIEHAGELDQDAFSVSSQHVPGGRADGDVGKPFRGPYRR